MTHKKEGQHCNAGLKIIADKHIIRSSKFRVNTSIPEYPEIVSIGEILDKLFPQLTRQNGA